MEPTKRFSNRTEFYSKFRPTYPQKIIEILSHEGILDKNTTIADIGSGTGKLTSLFLKKGNIVFGVEPNAEMRKVAEKLFEQNFNFISVEGSAEYTTLNKKSINLIVVGQAFHWFDVEKSKEEFLRILKEDGCVVLIWNKRIKKGYIFGEKYEALIKKFGIDYDKIQSIKINYEKFFRDGKYKLFEIPNMQILNFESLKGRLLSSSYIPLAPLEIFCQMIGELRTIFGDHKDIDNTVKLKYTTELYLGRL